MFKWLKASDIKELKTTFIFISLNLRCIIGIVLIWVWYTVYQAENLILYESQIAKWHIYLTLKSQYKL